MEHIAISGGATYKPVLFRGLELRYLVDFATCNEGMDEKGCQDQLRALWTAYCLHNDLVPDTCGYDRDILSLWNKLQEAGNANAWGSYEAFDLFMGNLLC